MGKAKNTMTVDVDVLVSQMAALIDSKIATALNNAANGAPVYSQTAQPAAPAAPAQPAQPAPVPAPAPVVVAPAVGEVVKLGDIEIRLDSVTKQGNKCAAGVRGLLVDSRTGARFYLMGAKLFKAKSDEIPDNIAFIASIK